MAINPEPGILLYPRIRRTPYYYAHREHGVKLYSVYNRMYHPRLYTDPLDEYWALVNHVTLWDVSVERQVQITGPDAFEFANMLVPRDLTKCKVGQCKYVFITSPTGGILNELEKAHIYIEQLHKNLQEKDAQIAEVMDRVESLEALLARLESEE